MKNLATATIAIAIGCTAGLTAAKWSEHASPPAIVAKDFSKEMSPFHSPIVLVASEDCIHCKNATAFLKANGAAFETVSAASEQGRTLLHALNEKAVPVLLTAKTKIRGFQAPAYQTALADTLSK